jgi:dipeptidyl aminopeptidase/acylaminoacyl peptidase
MRFRFCRYCLLLVWFAARTAAAEGPAPVATLFRDHDGRLVQLSPDGSTLATGFWFKASPYLWLTGLSVLDRVSKQPRILFREDHASVWHFLWYGSDGLAVTSIDANETTSGLVGFHGRGAGVKAVLPLYLDDMTDPRMILRGATPLVALGDGASVLMVRRRSPGQKSRTRWFGGADASGGVFRVDMATGKFERVATDPGFARHWYVDHDGKPRVVFGEDRETYHPDGRIRQPERRPDTQFHWVDDRGAARRIGAILTGEDEHAVGLGFDPAGKRFLFVGRQGRDRAAVYAYLPGEDRVEGPVLGSDTVEIAADDAARSPHDGAVVSVTVREGRSRVVWLDAELERIARELQTVLPDFLLTFRGWSRDRKQVLVRASSPAEPDRFYLYDESAGTLEEVLALNAELRGYAAGTPRPVAFAARDGVTLHGYLTAAVGAPAGRVPPLVMLVHRGGVRDADTFDATEQFFATRGYTVLRVNVRGSAGYGREFERRGYGEFGDAMIGDIFDGAEWAVREGHATADRLAIAGASYGGYAVLRAMTLRPEFFKAGLAFVPFADVTRQVDDFRRREEAWAFADWVKRVGHPDRDRAKLDRISPVHELTKLRAPLFVGFSEEDKRVEFRHSTELLRRLRASKREFVYHMAEETGHELRREESRIKMFEAAEKFLAERFPAGRVPATTR